MSEPRLGAEDYRMTTAHSANGQEIIQRRCCRGTAAEEEALEQEADTLLRSLPRDGVYPAYTEAQLARKHDGYGHCVISTEALVEFLANSRPAQSTLDELAFLASLTELNRPERLCLQGWLLGCTQEEVCRRWAHELPGYRQQAISRHLRSALTKCYACVDVSFWLFSRHALYRRPIRRHVGWWRAFCPACKQAFVRAPRADAYCSADCRRMARREKRRK